MKKRIVSALSLAMLLGSAPLAVASHYRLPVENLVNDAETSALGKAGVATTAALLDQVAQVQSRQKLAAKTGLTFVRLSTLASQVDLLRVSGLGPSMVLLLQAAGVKHTRDLKASSPADLREKMRVANDVQNLAPVIPQEDVIRDWIAQASQLPQVVEGLK
ncbi:MAG: DUF4332 domain-containing protein [Myxococcota bacterium]